MPKIIHSMIRVLDLERSVAFYKQAFGLDKSHRWDFSTFTLLYLRDPESGFELELTANKGQVEPYTHGTGYGHLAFCVPDLEAHRAKLLESGYPGRKDKIAVGREFQCAILLCDGPGPLQDRGPGESRRLRLSDSEPAFPAHIPPGITSRSGPCCARGARACAALHTAPRGGAGAAPMSCA